MATPLDTGLLQYFGVIFPFLFVFAVVFGVLEYTKIFKENKAIQALIAIVLAFFVLLSSMVREVINLMSPWFVLLFLFIMFALIAFKMMGAGDDDILDVLKSPDYRYINYIIMIFIFIIVFGAIAKVMSDRGGIGETGTTNITMEDGTVKQVSQENEFWNTIVNPKVLGMVLILLIASMTVMRLASY